MRERCLKPDHRSYPCYGGLGITICDRWLHSFEAFLEDMGERPPGTTLDRLENSQGYSPGNCAWRTPKQQMRNRRCTTWVEADGKCRPLAEVAEEAGVDVDAVRRRLISGASLNDAVELARKGYAVTNVIVQTADGPRSLVEIGKAAVVPHRLFARRVVECGWSIETALKTPSRSRKPDI